MLCPFGMRKLQDLYVYTYCEIRVCKTSSTFSHLADTLIQRDLVVIQCCLPIVTSSNSGVLSQVWRVVDFCCQYLEQEVSEDNFLYLQQLAQLYSLQRLDLFIDHFILQRFSTLSFTPHFLRDLPVHKLTVYLASEQVRFTMGLY